MTPTVSLLSARVYVLYCLRRALESFVDAVAAVNAGTARPSDFDRSLAAIGTTFRTTAILEAGRRSLDGACTVTIQYGNSADPCHPTGFAVAGQV